MADLVGYGYAAFVTIGGIIGYIKAGSTVSLGMGLLMGGLSGVGAYMNSQSPRSCVVLLLSSGALAAAMGVRFYNSGKIWPPGVMAILSLGMVAKCGVQMMQ
ncbi:transmembrane protein 14C-like [Lingula anatina]|uniref:Transmembrane protein 14C n=1 Tax=Lingula anatina TaxID=7574 RepID=A0A1S3JKH5_LINAN|nr:transmembrane protein 14C-like [Lingula anatina]|eukprot:XP_013410626.1 transmembrane protein 14C-like [Lingula anatina]